MVQNEPTPVTIIVPCYNEEAGLHQLADSLTSFIGRCEGTYQVSLVIVDDGSTDNTWDLLQSLFGHQPFCRLVRFDSNRGISAALAHGSSVAETDIICTMDSDCTYDPGLFIEMIPLLQGNVGMVTASPYHRDGRTEQVSAARLLLSKGLSVLYRLVLYQKIATYTCCFRVYHRSALQAVKAKTSGFIGIAELAARLDHAGYGIVEYPAVLKSRRYGVSKMRTIETILGHLKLLAQFGWARMVNPRPPMQIQP
ncbi:MAG: glycosyltransferase family 2 protein [Hyphomicrobiales bacterium]|nr:glycosyltransferase family 2 protein [Hyphomicrobiales bacterium]